MATAMAMPTQNIASQAQPQEETRQELPRPYKCPLCEKAFHRLEHQTRHIRTHTGEKPHACQYAGCTKRFSRSDELTRHSRIHNNPNSRRGKQNHHAAAAAALVNGSLPEGQVAHVMGPPPYGAYPTSTSNMASPNVSPPYTYSTNPNQFAGSSYSYSAGGSPESYSRHGLSQGGNMNLLATAASHVARENDVSSYSTSARPIAVGQTQYPTPSYSRHHPYDRQSSARGLAAYHYSPQHASQPMSRSHSHDEDDPYAHRMTKRSRPASPFSTNPPSPTFSNGSYSPTPGHTPAMTPAHSPRIRAKQAHYDKEHHLPGIRSLSLQQHIQSPALEPLEPSTEASGANGQSYTPYSRSQNSSSTGLRITDIINREDGTQRKLPIPNLPGADMEVQNLPSLSHSGASSAAGSVTNDSWLERR